MRPVIAPQQTLDRIQTRFHYLYGDQAEPLLNRLAMMMGRYGVGQMQAHTPPPTVPDEKEIVLITYGDMVQTDDESPLRTLNRFLTQEIGDGFTAIHVLPFFPYSSDDGFSVVDYRIVDPALGTWNDLEELGRRYRLMVDLVINHVSRQSAWFTSYVNDIAPYRGYFHEIDPSVDLSAVMRPRSGPLLSETPTRRGVRHLWATFGPDQIDVNFANPDVLFEYLDILLHYIARGAHIIRLDAIAYLWKVVGTSCVHLTQTHEVVKLLRDYLGLVAPHVRIITETNVPHQENIQYFGNGDEAHMVYQFSLPPLLAHGLLNGYAGHLTSWAASLPECSNDQAFLNFTASHDGIGVRPLQGLVPKQELSALVQHVEELGGHVSYKRNPDGTESPYELNITYFDLFAESADHVTESHIDRFLSSQAIMLAMRGVPAVYFNSLFGARNHHAGVQQTGHYRTINRGKWQQTQLRAMLRNPDTWSHDVFTRYLHLLRARRAHTAFHPNGRQCVWHLGDQVFALERTAPSTSEPLLSLTSFSHQPVDIDLRSAPSVFTHSVALYDLIAKQRHSLHRHTIKLAPWQTMWLIPAT